jgi:hypothetical protein
MSKTEFCNPLFKSRIGYLENSVAARIPTFPLITLLIDSDTHSSDHLAYAFNFSYFVTIWNSYWNLQNKKKKFVSV